MRKLAFFAIPAALLLFAGTASAHTASSTCERITIAKSALSANVYNHDTAIVALGPVKSGTYKIAAGDYDVVWADGFAVPGLRVEVCPSASPSPTPSPTSSPAPSQSAQPSATPRPSITPRPTPPATDTASHDDFVSNAFGAVIILALFWLGLMALFLAFFQGADRRPRR